jgi:hypothetical protein
MFARTVPEPPDFVTGPQIREAGFYKEFRASQIVFEQDQVRDYSCLLDEPSLRSVPPAIARQARFVAIKFQKRLERLGILYPKVQRSKNVATESAILYTQMKHKPLAEVKTVDLEVLYYETGVQIGGCCELRSAWRFNDLKPRLYYCQGGDQYFASRYVKHLAVALMEAIPTTERRRRTNPELYLHQEFDKDYVTVWDFESFTTNLSELKFFLFYIAEALKDLGDVELRLFDYREGIVLVKASDLLHQYNEDVNIQAPFSIHRIVDRYLYDEDGSITYRQQNSGMLGVAGNIGFSTALHGYAILEEVGPDNGVCVGDDAKSISRQHPGESIIPAMSELGLLHPDKCGIIEPYDYHPYRFLKRAFYREPDGSFYRDVLLNFPIAPYVDGHVSHRDVLPPSTPWEYHFKVAISVGGLLWSLLDHLEIPGTEIDIVYSFLSHCYQKLGLPPRGFLPGYSLTVDDERYKVSFACPSIQFDRYDPRVVDWIDFLIADQHQHTVLVQTLGYRSPVVLPVQGDVFYAVQDPFFSAMEDIGTLKCTKVVEEHFVLSEKSVAELKRWLKKGLRSYGEGPLCRYDTVKDIAPCHQFFFVPDCLDVLTREELMEI